MRTVFLVLAGISSAASWSFCQERVEDLKPTARQSDSLNTASIFTDKNLNTYSTFGAVRYRGGAGPLSLSVNELFVSTVIQTDRKRITDEQNFDLFARHRLTDRLQAAGKVSSLVVSDNQSLGITNVSAHAVYGGVEFSPVRSFAVTPLVGMRYENQTDQRDRGPSYLLGFDSDSMEYGGYRTEMNGKWQYDHLSPRVVETRNINVSAEKTFLDRTRNVVQFKYSRNRRDFYSPADAGMQARFGVSSNIETRTEDAFAAGDSLDYDIGRQILLKFQGNIFSRQIDRETRYKTYLDNPNPGANTTTKELKIEGSTEAIMTLGSSLTSSLRLFYQERDEKHQVQPDDSLSTGNLTKYTSREERRNNHSRRTTLSSNITMAFSSSQSLSVTGSTSILRYDTPSQENDDDRDELWHNVNLTFFSRFNQHLHLRVSVDLNLVHLVYLGSTRSADNTWNRIFRLSPRLEYSPTKAVTSVNTFEVLANYTAYDFEYPSSPIRSFVFRQFGFNDSTTVELTHRLSVELFALARFFERGEFRWEDFAERPLTYVEETTFIGALRYQLTARLLFSVGIRYFNQSRFAYKGNDRQIDQLLRSTGPISAIAWNVGGRTELAVKGWYEDQRQTGAPHRGIANMTMALVVHI